METMKVIAAYLLAVLGGNTSPSADDLKRILGSVGAEADNALIEFLLWQVEGKDLNELIAVGREKLASMSGGGIAVAASPTAGDGGDEDNAAAPSAPAATEAKKEQEEEEEEDEEFCLDLFG